MLSPKLIFLKPVYDVRIGEDQDVDDDSPLCLSSELLEASNKALDTYNELLQLNSLENPEAVSQLFFLVLAINK